MQQARLARLNLFPSSKTEWITTWRGQPAWRAAATALIGHWLLTKKVVEAVLPDARKEKEQFRQHCPATRTTMQVL